MSYSQRLKSWENYQQIIESQIADIEKRMNQYNQDIRAETNLAKRTQLNKQMDIYSTEINELYDKVQQITAQINKFKST